MVTIVKLRSVHQDLAVQKKKDPCGHCLMTSVLCFFSVIMGFLVCVFVFFFLRFWVFFSEHCFCDKDLRLMVAVLELLSVYEDPVIQKNGPLGHGFFTCIFLLFLHGLDCLTLCSFLCGLGFPNLCFVSFTRTCV